MKKLTFCKGPLLCAHFIFCNAQIKKITLSASSQFEAVIEGETKASLFLDLSKWLEQYQHGNPFTELPLKLSSITPFQTKVLKTLQQLPFGKTMSYKELAILSGFPKASRAVGTACKKNPFPLVIPCHRVISSSGTIGGFAYGTEMKISLLKFENSCE